MSDTMQRLIVNHCGPVLLGCKPAALFPVCSEECLKCLLVFLPENLSLYIIKNTQGRRLVMVYEKNALANIAANHMVRTMLAGFGYPSAASVLLLLAHLRRRFEQEAFPHEVGIFLGYPLEDVRGFITHRGQNYKLCGYWKVYGDTEQAKRLFKQYDYCREYMKKIFARLITSRLFDHDNVI